jgi:hypothetical protein
MKFRVIRKFVFQKLSLKRKEQLWRFFLTLINPSNLHFFALFGAVKRTKIDVKHFYADIMQPRSKEIIEELNELIARVESKALWPAAYRIRFIDGMSGQSFRALINLLFSNKNKSYLEIGTWKGSTFCSAIYSNSIEAICIDNWSEFGSPSQIALRNISKRTNDSSKVSILNSDFRKVPYNLLVEKEVDVYFFDGPHSQEDHYDAVTILRSLNFSSILYIVDDWNWDNVRQGTLHGLDSLGIRIAGKIEIFANSETRGRQSRWHNGYAFLVLERDQF